MKINKQKFYNAEELHTKWMKDPKYVVAYEALEPEFQIARQMIRARLDKKMSQQMLAQKVKTGQAVISRLEGMEASPSLALLKRISSALGIKFELSI